MGRLCGNSLPSVSKFIAGCESPGCFWPVIPPPEWLWRCGICFNSRSHVSLGLFRGSAFSVRARWRGLGHTEGKDMWHLKEFVPEAPKNYIHMISAKLRNPDCFIGSAHVSSRARLGHRCS